VRFNKKWYYLILSIPLIIGLLITLEGYYHPKLGFLTPIGVSVLSGTIVGFFMSLTTAQVTATATSKATMIVQNRSGHLEDLKSAFIKDGSPVRADSLRHLLGDSKSFSETEELQRTYLMDVKNHWPKIFKKFVTDKQLKDRNDKTIEEMENKIKEETKLLICDSINQINSHILTTPEAISSFFQNGTNISSLDSSSLKITGKSRESISNALNGLILGRNIVPFDFSDQSEARKKVSEILEKYLNNYLTVPESGSPGPTAASIGVELRNIIEKNSPAPIRNSLVDVNESHKAVSSIVDVLKKSIFQSERFNSIIDSNTNQVISEKQTNESGLEVENAVRSLLATRYLPNDCSYTVGDKS
jgi:hypothetical protein